MSVREQVLAAFAAVFSGATGVGEAFEGVIVERNRDKQVSRFPTLVIIDGDQTALHDNSGFTLYSMAVGVEGYIEAASDATRGAELNDLYAKVIAAANADHTLGGLAADLRETDMSIEIDREGSKPLASFSVGFDIDYMTQAGDPNTVGP